jgi:hypothetical protein
MTFLTIPLIAAVATGQTYQTYGAPTTYGTPVVSGFAAHFDNIYKDFGTVPHGSQNVHRFVFTNKTDKEVFVTGVRSSCRCAIPRAVKESAKPGEKLEIEVVYDARTFTSERSMTITVDMHSDRYEQVQLKVRGFSRQDVILEPGKVDLGVVKFGKEQTQKVRLEYAGSLDWKVLDVVPGQWAKAKVEEKSRQYGLVKYEVTLTVPPNAPRGSLVDAVQLKTNDPSSPVVRIDVVGTLDGGIQPSLSTVKFGEVAAGKPVRQKIFIKGDRPFIIGGAQFDIEKLPVSLRSTQGEKTIHTLEIEFNPSKPGKFEETLNIRAEPQAELVPIKIVAQAK